jgi:hypothetical protein
MVTSSNVNQDTRPTSGGATPDSEMARLQAAAEVTNEGLFLSAMNSMDWHTRSAADFLYATQLALEAGAFVAARQLSALGAELYPEEPLIERYSHTLAPPMVVGKRPSQGPGTKANRDWLKAHGDEYRGKWIGLRNGVLLGAAEAFEDLLNYVGKAKDILITKVY